VPTSGGDEQGDARTGRAPDQIRLAVDSSGEEVRPREAVRATKDVQSVPPIAPELDAVASGKKAMSSGGFLVADFYDDPSFIELVQEALARNLVVVLGSQSPPEAPIAASASPSLPNS
jgi:hypothetical protein